MLTVQSIQTAKSKPSIEKNYLLTNLSVIVEKFHMVSIIFLRLKGRKEQFTRNTSFLNPHTTKIENVC